MYNIDHSLKSQKTLHNSVSKVNYGVFCEYFGTIWLMVPKLTGISMYILTNSEHLDLFAGTVGSFFYKDAILTLLKYPL